MGKVGENVENIKYVKKKLLIKVYFWIDEIWVKIVYIVFKC